MDKSRLIINLILVVAFFSFVSVAGAAKYDFGDAVGYGQAQHTTDEWQKLGSGWSNESAQRSYDTFDDGVAWSTDGTTWNTWERNETVTFAPGTQVKFRFTFTRALYGNHSWDDLRAWIDWNGDKVWNDNEELFYQRVDKGNTQVDDTTYYDDPDNPDHKRYNSESMYFYTSFMDVGSLISTDETVWLRARVSCSESVETFNNDNGLAADAKISSIGYLWQGETEDYALRSSTVPVPGAVWLLGSGLLGLIGIRRRKS